MSEAAFSQHACEPVSEMKRVFWLSLDAYHLRLFPTGMWPDCGLILSTYTGGAFYGQNRLPEPSKLGR